MNKKLFFSIVYFFYLNLSIGQEQLALHTENFAGINAISINPANSFITPHRWDINIASAGLFFENNYGFLKNTNFIKLYKNRSNPAIVIDTKEDLATEYSKESVLLDFFDRKKPSYFATQGNLTGPSVSIKINKNESIGFVTAYRFIGGVQKLPAELNYYTYFNKPFFQAFPVTSFNAGFISWQEYGLNYVKKINGYTTVNLFGGSIKYLSGNEAAFMNNKQTSLVQQMRGDSIAVLDRMDLEYGYTTTIFKPNRFKPKQNGAGVSIDLGTTIIFGESIKNYNFRIGLSLLDLGFINFRKNTAKYRINVDTLTVFDLDGFKEINKLSQLDSVSKIISRQIYNDPGKTFVANSFTMLLPSALSIQFDYSLSNLFFINATLIQRLTTQKKSVIRANLFAISPRIEHRWFSISTPLVIYDWKSIRLGASVRLAYLTIGSDNLFSLYTNQEHFTGSDFYIGLKFNPFFTRKKSKYGRNLNKHIKCYEFQ